MGTWRRSGWRAIAMVVSVLAMGGCGSDSDADPYGTPDLEMVDPVAWHAQMCEITDPFLPAMQAGFALVSVPDGEGGFEPGVMDEDALHEVDDWMSDSADLAEDIVSDLADIGAPQSDRGLDLALSQLDAYRATAVALRDAADRFDPSAPESGADVGAIIEAGATRLINFGLEWAEVEPFSLPCPTAVE